MHVVFVSVCEKRAIKRTRAILDSYALRVGDHSWATPITQEALMEVKRALKSTATRQTAVACYRNFGNQRMDLMWIIGSQRRFGLNGVFPVNSTQTRRKIYMPTWLRIAALLVEVAGLTHDWGKASQGFQQKLRAKKSQPDPARHEWLSTKLLHNWRRHQNWDSAWDSLAKILEKDVRELPVCKKIGLNSGESTLNYLIATHHRLFGPKDPKNAGSIDHSNHLRESALSSDWRCTRAKANDLNIHKLEPLWERLHKREETSEDPLFWRGLATISRAALILADHSVSARVYREKIAAKTTIYANTRREKEKSKLNQPLGWHLETVSTQARQILTDMMTMDWPSLSPQSVAEILQPAPTSSRYAWQDHAISVLESAHFTPTLVLNMAATGSGKTRMNAKLACALRPTNQVRFTTVLNLRSLTLQTGDAYREELKIQPDELSVVIGSALSRQLHETLKTTQPMQKADVEEVDEDGNPPEEIFEVLGEIMAPGKENALLQAMIKPQDRRLVLSPVLVSTIDYVVAAGEPQKQGHHALALIRVLNSDLIIDEIDSYDPSPLVAVLRVVQMAGLLGRHVIASSATLSRPVADALIRMYDSGLRLRMALLQKQLDYHCAFIDDRLPAERFVVESSDFAMQRYEARLTKQMNFLRQNAQKNAFRRPCLATISESEQSIEGWHEEIASQVAQMHAAHCWHFSPKKRISIGLVRIANIKRAIPVAQYLAEKLPCAYVAAYHGQDLFIQRFLKEYYLDRWLKRHPRKEQPLDEHLRQCPEFQRWVNQKTMDEIIFVVVATPVEEVGRDHDFDWAVVEPSSSQSIVQLCGRVNRHRLQHIKSPNIAILQFNARAIEDKSIVFCRPGLETKDFRYPTHDMGELLNWSELDTIDARLRFEDHPLAQADDQSLRETLKSPLRELIDKPTDWMKESTYAAHPLRDRESQTRWRVNREGQFERWEVGSEQAMWIGHALNQCSVPANAWLSWDWEALYEEADRLSIDDDMALSVELPSYQDQSTDNLWWHPAFGITSNLG